MRASGRARRPRRIHLPLRTCWRRISKVAPLARRAAMSDDPFGDPFASGDDPAAAERERRRLEREVRRRGQEAKDAGEETVAATPSAPDPPPAPPAPPPPPPNS